MKLNIPLQSNLDYRENNEKQKLFSKKSEFCKRMKIRKFIRIKRKIKTKKNKGKNIRHKKHCQKEKNKNNEFYASSLYSTQERLIVMIDSISNNLNDEEKFDPQKSKIDLLNCNDNNNKINIEGNCKSNENSHYLRNETIYVGFSFKS